MTNDSQEQVRTFIAEHGLGGDASDWVHDLQSELGEVSKEILKETEYGEHDTSDVTFGDDMAQEVGDLYFSLLGLANALGIELDKALDTVLEKYAERMDTTGSAGSGR